MADNITSIAKNGDIAIGKIMKKLTHGSGTWEQSLRRRVWLVATNAPSVDLGSQATYPVRTGDLVYRVDSDYAYICTVAPTATTAATFVKLHA